MLHYKNRTGIFWSLLFLCITLSVFLSQSSLLAQGLFIVVSEPTEVAKTNRSALSGSLIFAVEAGTTAAGKIIIDYGIPIEDSGTVFDYPLAAIEETDLASGILTVKIPQGVGARDPITLGGVRFDMAAADVERVVANLRVAPGSGFVIRENYLSVEVISRVLPGLEVDLESDLVFILPASFFRPASLTLAIKEGFSTAFSGNTEFNQNVSTRVQIQIEGLPEGVSVTLSRIGGHLCIGCNLHRAGAGLKPRCRPRMETGRLPMSSKRAVRATSEWRLSNSTTRSKW